MFSYFHMECEITCNSSFLLFIFLFLNKIDRPILFGNRSMSAVAAPPPHREGSDFEEYRGDHKVDDAKGEQL